MQQHLLGALCATFSSFRMGAAASATASHTRLKRLIYIRLFNEIRAQKRMKHGTWALVKDVLLEEFYTIDCERTGNIALGDFW